MDVSSVEAQLAEIEEEYSSGRMNAFGPAMTHDAMTKELRKIADLELQIFLRSSNVLKLGVESDFLVQNAVVSGTGGPSGAGDASSAGGSLDTTLRDRSMDALERSLSISTSLPTGVSPRNTASTARGGADSPQQQQQQPFKPHLYDRCFQDVTRHLRALEASFDFVGDSLRHISRHVLTLNDMAEKVNATAK